MSLRLNGSTSGYVEIDAPAAAGSNTLILPTGNGTANYSLVNDGSGNLSWFSGGPAFSAGGTTQTISPSTTTKVVLGTVNFDTASSWDTGTNRFTPNVAGYYFLAAEAQYTGSSTSGLFILRFNFNGTSRELSVDDGLDQYMRRSIQFFRYLNGSTDWVEFEVRHTNVSSRTIGSTYFHGFLAHPA